MKRIGSKQLNCRGYKTRGYRKQAIKMLIKRGYNHFICFKDVSAPIALMYAKADKPDIYINW
jgi:hypothetical protein